jgi:hypothetical protein
MQPRIARIARIVWLARGEGTSSPSFSRRVGRRNRALRELTRISASPRCRPGWLDPKDLGSATTQGSLHDTRTIVTVIGVNSPNSRNSRLNPARRCGGREEWNCSATVNSADSCSRTQPAASRGRNSTFKETLQFIIDADRRPDNISIVIEFFIY